MPYIQLKTNLPISKEREVLLKTMFGRQMSLLPGKCEHWLMVEIEDNRKLYFRGSDEPCSILEVKVYGKAKDTDYQNLTEALTKTVHETLEIPEDRIYVEYEETPYWGYSGCNF